MGDLDSYDISQNASSLFPPEYYLDVLADPAIMKRIGAEVAYSVRRPSIQLDVSRLISVIGMP